MRKILPFVLILISTNSFAQSQLNTAFSFDGHQYINLPSNTSSLVQNTNITFEAWIKKNEAIISARMDIMAAQDHNGWGVFFVLGDTLAFCRTGYFNALCLNPITDTQWHHIAITHNGSLVRFYIDGVFINNSPLQYNWNYSGPYSIGGFTGTSGNFKGYIDELRVWSILKDQAQIQQLMCNELVGPQNGLKLYYKFNETAPDIVNDFSGNILQGTMYADPGYLFDQSYISKPSVPFSICLDVGINDIDNTLNLSIAPNYTYESFLITAQDIKDIAKLALFNSLGQVVWHFEAKGEELSKGVLVNLPGISKGLYTLQINNAHGRTSKKIIIE